MANIHVFYVFSDVDDLHGIHIASNYPLHQKHFTISSFSQHLDKFEVSEPNKMPKNYNRKNQNSHAKFLLLRLFLR